LIHGVKSFLSFIVPSKTAHSGGVLVAVICTLKEIHIPIHFPRLFLSLFKGPRRPISHSRSLSTELVSDTYLFSSSFLVPGGSQTRRPLACLIFTPWPSRRLLIVACSSPPVIHPPSKRQTKRPKDCRVPFRKPLLLRTASIFQESLLKVTRAISIVRKTRFREVWVPEILARSGLIGMISSGLRRRVLSRLPVEDKASSLRTRPRRGADSR
jgi:hypothetical protein